MKKRFCSALLLAGVAIGFLASCTLFRRDLARAPGGTVVKDGKTGIQLVVIPAGTFMMGASEGSSNERPVHKVQMKSFLMARTEVTVAQFARFVKATGYVTDAEKVGCARGWDGIGWVSMPGVHWRKPSGPSGDQYPVRPISWNDAVAYCEWAKMRLPTDAEWEYAAGGGNEHLYWAGTSHDVELDQYAWFRLNSGRQLHPVGLKKPNSFGLYDMSGNVAEWCADWYGQNYYAESPLEDPQGPASGTSRVLRGGTAYNDATRIRISFRGMQPPGFVNCSIGFRPVRDLQGP